MPERDRDVPLERLLEAWPGLSGDEREMLADIAARLVDEEECRILGNAELTDEHKATLLQTLRDLRRS